MEASALHQLIVAGSHWLCAKLRNHHTGGGKRIVTPFPSILHISHGVFLFLAVCPAATNGWVFLPALARDCQPDWFGRCRRNAILCCACFHNRISVCVLFERCCEEVLRAFARRTVSTAIIFRRSYFSIAGDMFIIWEKEVKLYLTVLRFGSLHRKMRHLVQSCLECMRKIYG